MQSFFSNMWRGELRLGWFRAAGIAIGCVSAAALLRLPIDFVFGFGHAEAAPFFPAVLLATLFGGLRAGIIALVMSVLIVWWALPPTPFAFRVDSVGEAINLAIFAGALALIVWGSEHYRRLKVGADALAKHLMESEKRLRLALEAGGMGTWEWNIKTNGVLWSPSLEAIHGLAPGTFSGTLGAYQKCIHPEDRDNVLRATAETIKQGCEHRIEYRIMLPDGSVRWVEERGSISRYEAGGPASMIGVCTDITDRKHAEEKLKTVAQELEHRTRNILARVKAIVRMTTADTVSDFVQNLTSRVDALARLNSLMHGNKYQSAELDRVVAQEVESLCTSGQAVSIRGPKIALCAKGAESLGMVVHELTTNAAKYGALSHPDGQLAVEWSRQTEGRLTIDWTEAGIPLGPRPSRMGFGTKLVQTIVHQLQGEVRFDWRADGLHCAMTLPTQGILANAHSRTEECRQASVH